MQKSELTQHFDSVTPTRFPRLFIGKIKPYRSRVLWYVIAGDDLDDYAPTGKTYVSKVEAMAELPRIAADWFGA